MLLDLIRLKCYLKCDPHSRRFIADAVAEVTDVDLVPWLVNLGAKHKWMTPAVVSALKVIYSPKAVSTLAAALDAKEGIVQYDAVMGISFQNRGRTSAPALDRFQKAPEDFIGKCKQWWAQEKSKYPTQEDVVKEWEKTKKEWQTEADKGKH